MSDFLATFAAGAILSWVALPLLALAAARTRRPAERQSTLTLALILGAALFVAPWLRAISHHITALCVSKETLSAMLPVAPRPLFTRDADLLAVFPTIGAAALFLAVLGAIRVLYSTITLRRLVARAYPAPRALRERAAELAQGFGVAAPRVMVSAEAAAPFVARLFSPVLVVPEALCAALDPVRLDLVLRHELAHLSKRDLFRAWIVSIARVPYTFHPVAAWLAKEIAIAREQVVDAEVGGDDPHEYADLLIDVASYARFGVHHAEVAMSASALERRLMMLVEPSASTRAAFSSVIALGVGLFAITMLAPKSHVPVELESRMALETCWSPIGDERPEFSPAAPVIDEESCVLEEGCEQECVDQCP